MLGAPLRGTIAAALDAARLAGQDFELESPNYAPLDIVLDVCVADGYFRRDVESAVMARLMRGDPAQGLAPLLGPGCFALGQTVYLSPIIAAARAIDGVRGVRACVFQPQGVATRTCLDRGAIPMGAFQAALLDNDRNYPNHGQLRLVMAGGK